jgi:integral membrane protein
MSSPRTTPTSPGSLSRTGTRAEGVQSRLIGYRLAAYATGVMLLVLTTSVVLHYGFSDTRLVWSGPVHGFLYMGYLTATALLGTAMGWGPRRMVLVALAGTIPMMSFVAERSVTGEVRRQLAAAPQQGFRG